MGLLKPASGGAFLKAGFLGFEKSGKTHTAMMLALGTRSHFKLTGPLAFYDTEMGSDYWAERVEAETGQQMLVVKSRALVDLVETVKECIAAGVSVLVVDSVSHVWREVVDSYLSELQAKAKSRGWSPPEELKFQDWAPIKSMWARWSDSYLTAPLHIVACGRAGFTYDFETNDRGKKELVKTGTKMKAEEFGYEASLLVEMERETDKDGELVNRATIVGDRFDLINGKSVIRPGFDFFKPFVEKLAPASHAPVDTGLKTSFGLDDHRQDNWHREKAQREIVSEKIQAAFQLADLAGTSAESKKARSAAMLKFWGTTSWKELSERLPSARMNEGLVAFEIEHKLREAPKPLVDQSDEITWAPEAKPAGDATTAASGAPVLQAGEVACAGCEVPIVGAPGAKCEACLNS